MRKKSKIIVDTNLWISFSLSKKLGNLEKTIKDNELLLLYSGDLLNEIKDVFSRTKFFKILPKDSLQEIISLLKDLGRDIIISTEVNICRDSKDNFLLSLCKDGNADYLITGDKDLLELKKFEKTKIVTFTKFLSE